MNRFIYPILRIVFILAACLPKVYGQNNTQPLVYDLDACVQYALQNAASTKNAELGKAAAEGRINQTLADGLPQINGSVVLTDNLAIQTVFLPAVFFGGDAGDPNVPVQFGVPRTGIAGFTARQLIFDGSFFLGLKASKTYRELAVAASDTSKVSIVEKVSKAYYSVLVNQERLTLLQANKARLDTVLRQTQAMYENGFSEKIDVDRVKINYNNISMEFKKTERLIGLSKLLLKFQMGMPITEEIQVAGDLKQIVVESVQMGEQAESFDFNKRVDYRLLQTQLTLNELNIKQFQVQYMPNLYFNGAFGWNAGSSSWGDILGIRENTWFKYANVGLTLSVPVFDGFRKRAQIQQARLEMNQLQNSIKQVENGILLQQQQARINLVNNWENLLMQKENMDLSSSIYQTVRVKFQEGIGTSLELVEAETSYKEAETNYYAALYDALVARVDYQKALGELSK